MVSLCGLILCLAAGGERGPFPLFWHQREAAGRPHDVAGVLAAVEGVEADAGQVNRALRELVRIVPALKQQGVAVDEVLPPERARELQRLAAAGRAAQAAQALRQAAAALRQRLAHTRQQRPAGVITGAVLNSDGHPVPAAKVFVLGLPGHAMSDERGRFRLAGIPLASPRYIVVAQANGYLDAYAGRLAVAADRETRVTLRPLKLTDRSSELAGNLAVKIGYVLERRSSGAVVQPSPEAVIDPSLYPAHVRAYLEPSRAINSDHPRVKAVARRILDSIPADQRSRATLVAKAVYDWVVRNIRYDLVSNYPGDPTCGNWQTTFGGWGRSFDDWCYTAAQVIQQRRAICIEFERLASALLRALGIPARPAPLSAHPVTQWWVQLPDGPGYWCTFETSAGSTAFHQRGDLWARFPAVPDHAIAFWSPDASAPIHMDWDAGRDCLWLEDYGRTLIFEFNPAGEREARKALRAFAADGQFPRRCAHLKAGSPRQFGLACYEAYCRGFVLALPSIAGTDTLVARFPVFANGRWLRTLEMAHWTNKPEWVKRTYREKQTCESTGQALEWYCIEFQLPKP